MLGGRLLLQGISIPHLSTWRGGAVAEDGEVEKPRFVVWDTDGDIEVDVGKLCRGTL